MDENSITSNTSIKTGSAPIFYRPPKIGRQVFYPCGDIDEVADDGRYGILIEVRKGYVNRIEARRHVEDRVLGPPVASQGCRDILY